MPEPQIVDLLIAPSWVVPLQPRAVMLEEHAVVVRDGRIVDILQLVEARERYAPVQSVILPGHVLIPGLVNLHTHAAMSLMRGLADDLQLMKWLKGTIWPTEAKHVSPDFVYDGTLLACAEMLAGGVTCFSDMYYFPEASARAALACGMRAAIGLIAIDFPTQYASDPADYLAKGL